jgi:hypothetical protein
VTPLLKNRENEKKLLNLVRSAHDWNDGAVKYWVDSGSIWLKNNMVHGISKAWIENNTHSSI